MVDAKGCPVGMIDVTDVMGLLPEPKSTNANSSEELTIRIYPGWRARGSAGSSQSLFR